MWWKGRVLSFVLNRMGYRGPRTKPSVMLLPNVTGENVTDRVTSPIEIEITGLALKVFLALLAGHMTKASKWKHVKSKIIRERQRRPEQENDLFSVVGDRVRLSRYHHVPWQQRLGAILCQIFLPLAIEVAAGMEIEKDSGMIYCHNTRKGSMDLEGQCQIFYSSVSLIHIVHGNELLVRSFLRCCAMAPSWVNMVFLR